MPRQIFVTCLLSGYINLKLKYFTTKDTIRFSYSLTSHSEPYLAHQGNRSSLKKREVLVKSWAHGGYLDKKQHCQRLSSMPFRLPFDCWTDKTITIGAIRRKTNNEKEERENKERRSQTGKINVAVEFVWNSRVTHHVNLSGGNRKDKSPLYLNVGRVSALAGALNRWQLPIFYFNFIGSSFSNVSTWYPRTRRLILTNRWTQIFNYSPP